MDGFGKDDKVEEYDGSLAKKLAASCSTRYISGMVPANTCAASWLMVRYDLVILMLASLWMALSRLAVQAVVDLWNQSGAAYVIAGSMADVQ